MDVVYIKCCVLWPTWLSVPSLVKSVDTLHIQFRLFLEPISLDPDRRCPLLLQGSSIIGGQPPLAWMVHDLLLKVITHGPLIKPEMIEDELQKVRMTVKKLIINVVPPTEAGVAPTGPFEGRRAMREYFMMFVSKYPPGLDENYESARTFYNFLKSILRALLALTPDNVYYGKILFEAVGDIEIQLDGCEMDTINLLRLLANLPPENDPWRVPIGEEEMEEILKCKEEIIRKRKENGLPVPDPRDQENPTRPGNEQ